MGRKTATQGGEAGCAADGDADASAAGTMQGNPCAMMMGPMMMGGMAPAMPMMNPMMMCMNPMMGMMMMQANMRNMAGMQAGAQGAQATQSAAPSEPDKLLDPKVKAICRDFSIDDDTCGKLHDAMKDREDFDEDIQALHKVMERATRDGKKPLEAMLTQIRAIKSGRFAGKELLDPDIWAFIEKYNLDDRVINRLIQTLKSRRGKKKEDLKALDDRLGNAQQPARLGNAQQPTGLGLLVRLLEGLEETGRLPSPPRRLGGSGAYRPTGTFLHPSSGQFHPTGKGGGRGRSEERRHSRCSSRSRSPRSFRR